MPTIITGQRATAATNAIQSASRIIEMHDVIMLLEPSATPLTTFSSMVSRKAVGNPDFKVLEDELIPNIDRVNGAVAGTTATTFTVDNGAYVPVNSIIRIQRTGETMLVTGVATNVLTVTRSYGSTAAAALNDNDQYTIIGGAAAEGASAEAAKTTQKTSVTNYTQIFTRQFDMTRTTMESNLYGGRDLPYQQKKAGIEFGKDVEKAFFFGESVENTGGTTPRRTTGGIDTFISTNDTDLGGTFSLVTFFSESETFFRYGAKRKTAFCSRGAATNIALEGLGYIETARTDTTLGMEITRVKTPHGELNLISHDLLEGDEYGGRIYVVDMNNVGYRYLRNSDMKLKTNIQANDVDGRKDQYIGEIGLFRTLEETHGRFTNAA